MSASLTLCVLAGVLVGAGVTLLLARSLIRALLGVLLMGNGVNLAYLVASGRPGRAPILEKGTVGESGYPSIGPDGISDPLPQAMVLTAIVITLAVTAFSVALAHRSWQLQATDEVGDDLEDLRTHERAVANDMSDSDYQPADTRDDISPETQEDDEPDDEPGDDSEDGEQRETARADS